MSAPNPVRGLSYLISGQRETAVSAIAFDWYRGFLRWFYELELHYGRLSQHQRHAVLRLPLAGLAWKVAGYIGLDRFVLPYLGTPWPGKNTEEEEIEGSFEPESAPIPA